MTQKRKLRKIPVKI